MVDRPGPLLLLLLLGPTAAPDTNVIVTAGCTHAERGGSSSSSSSGGGGGRGGLEGRPVYLLGESFGGLLALAIAKGSPFVDRVVLVNPATSFADSPWPQMGSVLTSLPAPVYNLLPMALAPILTNPLAVALNGIFPPREATPSSSSSSTSRARGGSRGGAGGRAAAARTSSSSSSSSPSFFPPPSPADAARAVSDVAYGLLDLLPELAALRLVLPPETLAWRLALLKEGAASVNGILGKVPQRVLLVTGSADFVIPSGSEGPRLQKALPRCRLRSLPLRSHAMLQEAGVSLVRIMDEEGFYLPRRQLSSGGGGKEDHTPPSASASSRRKAAAALAAAAAAVTAAAPAAGGVATSKGGDGKGHSAKAGNGHPSRAPRSGGANFGQAAPVELPTPKELDKVMDSGGLKTLSRLVSPVFFSTNMETGKVERGLGNLTPILDPSAPSSSSSRASAAAQGAGWGEEDGDDVYYLEGGEGLGSSPAHGPILFVGNHQLFAPDMPLMVAQFLKEQRVLLRGLAHPFALEGFGDSEKGKEGDGMDKVKVESNVNDNDKKKKSDKKEDSDFGPSSFGALLKTFGAVPVSGSNLYKLLSLNEAALLYPGGAREAYKLKGEQYKLLWPQKQEFVRMAARFGATIVPFAAVGAEDGVNIVADSKEMREASEGRGDNVLLNTLMKAVGGGRSSSSSSSSSTATGTRAIPQARKGVNVISPEEAERLEETFVPPLITFNAPSRFYFVFRKPIETRPSMSREECEDLYRLTQSEVEAGIEYLLEKRTSDPYAGLGERLVYEASWKGKRQAPTFDP